MNLTNRYYLFLDDYHDEGQSAGRFFLGDEPEFSHDLDVNLCDRLLNQDYRHVWNQKFLPKPGIDKVLSVCGSEFGRRFFSAIARFMECSGFEYFKYEDQVQDPPLKLMDRPLSARMADLESLCGRYGPVGQTTIEIAIACGADGSAAEDIAREMNERSHSSGPVKVHFTGVPLTGRAVGCDLQVAIVDSDENLMWHGFFTSNNLVFYYNEKEEFDDVLNPQMAALDTYDDDHFLWQFNRRDTLEEVLALYVGCYATAPAFSHACRSFVDRHVGDLTHDDLILAMSLSRVFPFALAELDRYGVVGKRYVARVATVGELGSRRPDFTMSCQACKSSRQSDGDECFDFVPERPCEFVAGFARSQADLALPAKWQVPISFVVRNDSEVSIVDGLECAVEVKNHFLTTSFSVQMADAFSPDDVNYRIPVGETKIVTVTAKNEFDESVVPTDASEWSWEVQSSNGCRAIVEERHADSGVKFLSVGAESFGTLSLRVFWRESSPSAGRDAAERGAASPGGGELVVPRDLDRCMRVDVLPRGERLRYEIEAVPEKSLLPLQLKYDDRGNVSFECFPGDAFVLRAWLEGASEPLWDDRVKIKGTEIPPWSGRDSKHTMTYDTPGWNALEIMPVDPELDFSYRIECNVLKNHSDSIRKVMMGAVAVAGLHAWFSFGLSWWLTLVYVFPMCVYAFYRIRKYPLYKSVITLLFAVDVFMAIRALWQELS